MHILARLARIVVGAMTVASMAVLLVVGLGPRTGQFRTLTVLTASMEPAIPAGSVVVVRPIPTSEVRVGDVVTFEAPVEARPVVTHRVIEVVEPGARPVIRTKGDASDSPDPWRARLVDDTAWEVSHVVPKVGFALNALRDPMVHRVTVLATPVVFVVLVLFDIWSRPRSAESIPAGAR